MGNEIKGLEFKKFATPRIIGGIAIVIIVLWALSVIFGSSEGSSSKQHAARHDSAAKTAHTGGHQAGDVHDAASHDEPAAHKRATRAAEPVHTSQKAASGHGEATSSTAHGSKPAEHQAETAHGSAAAGHTQPSAAAGHPPASEGHAATGAGSDRHESPTTGHPIPVGTPIHKPMPKGVAFVEAAIQPLDYELEERWWGWRPNDIINVTDNVNNFQMGVLEVTRRTTVALAERISRTGTTDAFDENLEQAMNWFMVKASSYWFPSAESKYREGLEELDAYLQKLKESKATFYTRTDNLIPLLASLEDLLGSCDENLVKEVNEDGSAVSFFAVDNYFYYTKGVANSMATVLEAVHHDFIITLEARAGTELLHHAIVSCQKAASLDPWIILDRDLSSILANHRANMAAPISHARFYLGQLIKTLST
jgi:hypothetical protein